LKPARHAKHDGAVGSEHLAQLLAQFMHLLVYWSINLPILHSSQVFGAELHTLHPKSVQLVQVGVVPPELPEPLGQASQVEGGMNLFPGLHCGH
jgi:hypothetical protein